ncbi:hypothetical protein OHA04_37395 [Streptomyces sp. NBC_01590]|uniref:hypothetical protein n=1 Tax=Streptomyces sp. NBC_01590 TaxID=2975887 RepID=UPI0038642341
MSTQTPVITEDIARHVLWHYGCDGGIQPGSYTERLMETIDAADVVNAEILRGAYPELVAAMLTAKDDIGGVEHLQQIAGGLRCIRCSDVDGPFGGSPQRPLCEACLKVGA